MNNTATLSRAVRSQTLEDLKRGCVLWEMNGEERKLLIVTGLDPRDPKRAICYNTYSLQHPKNLGIEHLLNPKKFSPFNAENLKEISLAVGAADNANGHVKELLTQLALMQRIGDLLVEATRIGVRNTLYPPSTR